MRRTMLDAIAPIATTATAALPHGCDGRDVPARSDAVPFFWSQHYDVAISYVGHAARWDHAEIDGDIGEKDCSITYRLRGESLAVATIFRDRESLAAELAMERRSRPWANSASRASSAAVQ